MNIIKRSMFFVLPDFIVTIICATIRDEKSSGGSFEWYLNSSEEIFFSKFDFLIFGPVIEKK